MSLSIIIPAYNEEKNIENVIMSIEQNVNMEHETVVIDDHSNDKTSLIVQELAKENKNIRLVKNDYEHGFANALRKGFDSASHDMILPVMADLCDDPNTINEVYGLALKGYDIVCGSRYMKGGRKIGGPKVKSFFSRFVGFSLNLFIGIPTKDISNSFKLYRKTIIDSINIESKGFDISAEISLKAYFQGYKITEVPTTWINRKEGKSKFNIFKHGSRYLKLYLWAIMKAIRIR